MRFRFGDFTLDSASHLLLRGPDVVHLEPKAFQLLAILIVERPRAISKAELMEKLWPGTFVQESNLTSLVRDLRSALEDDARRPVFLRTVHGYGYAFAGEAVESSPLRLQLGSSRLWLAWGENVLRLSEGENIIGREPEARIWIGHRSVSRRHARIVVEGDSAVLEDLGSKNGTFVGTRSVTTGVRLTDGDEVGVGSVKLVFHVVSGIDATATTA